VLRQFIEWLEAGERTPEALVSLCLRHIAHAEPEVRAWVEVNPRPCPPAGPLRGVPFGAKDIIETRGMATEYGSPLYRGRQGERDAHIIGLLESAGAVLLGKTETTAFASFDPAPTRNPRLPGHTPGGSSAGSAAAVAAGMVPFAVGTQTLGSVLRPASYCGVCGFKPTYGLIPADGVLPFAPSLDTLGFFTETAGDMLCLWSRLRGGGSRIELRRAACFPGAAASTIGRLRAAGVAVDALEPPPGWQRLAAAALTVNDYEGARSHAGRYREFGERIGRRLAELVRRGQGIPEAEYEDARAHIAAMREEFARLFREYPAILSPAATGPAPAGLASTGDPAANAPWTALGVPAISVPLPAEGPPLGLQMTAAEGRDDDLAAMAAQAEALLRAD
jgi:Asp-tRNA(Asn)/Glu-tRNA(Gln) amidotransferase A subunit family amidase